MKKQKFRFFFVNFIFATKITEFANFSRHRRNSLTFSSTIVNPFSGGDIPSNCERWLVFLRITIFLYFFSQNKTALLFSFRFSLIFFLLLIVLHFYGFAFFSISYFQLNLICQTWYYIEVVLNGKIPTALSYAFLLIAKGAQNVFAWLLQFKYQPAQAHC